MWRGQILCLIQGFINSQSLGKMIGCKDVFACLVDHIEEINYFVVKEYCRTKSFAFL